MSLRKGKGIKCSAMREAERRRSILEISKDCKGCFDYCVMTVSYPPCIAYELEPWHYPRMVSECRRVRGTFYEIFEKDLEDIKRLWARRINHGKEEVKHRRP